MFHEQVFDESDKRNKELDILLLVEGSEETGNSHEEQQKAEAESLDTTINMSPSKETQNRVEATPILRRSGRQIQLPNRYMENAFITSMMNVVEPSSYREANQCSEWKIAKIGRASCRERVSSPV